MTIKSFVEDLKQIKSSINQNSSIKNIDENASKLSKTYLDYYGKWISCNPNYPMVNRDILYNILLANVEEPDTSKINLKSIKADLKTMSTLISLTKSSFVEPVGSTTHLSCYNDANKDSCKPKMHRIHNSFKTLTKDTLAKITQSLINKNTSDLSNYQNEKKANQKFYKIFEQSPKAMRLYNDTVELGDGTISKTKHDDILTRVTVTHRIPAKSKLFKAICNYYANMAGHQFKDTKNFLNCAKKHITGINWNFGKNGNLTSLYWTSFENVVPMVTGDGRRFDNTSYDYNYIDSNLLGGNGNGEAQTKFEYLTDKMIYNEIKKTVNE